MRTSLVRLSLLAALAMGWAAADARADAPFDSAEAMSAHPSRWVIDCGKNRRRAVAVKLDPSGRIESGSLAWTDYPNPPMNVEGSLIRENGTVRLSLRTSGGLVLTASGDDPSRLPATVRFSDGKTRGCTLFGADGRADFHRHAYFPNPGAPVTVVAISAMNCPLCTAWKFEERDAWKQAPSFSRVTFREVEAYTFNDIGDESRWPDDLKWVLKATTLKQGTPRFLILDGHEVVMNVAGREGWKRIVLPVLEAIPAP